MPYTNIDVVQQLRDQIPSFRCVAGCHDCCGPVTVSTEEMARLPVKTDVEHDAALAELSCAYLGKSGCEIYDERPLICRLYGTTPRLRCPNGQRPVNMIDDAVEAEIHRFLRKTRQVLL